MFVIYKENIYLVILIYMWTLSMGSGSQLTKPLEYLKC